MNRNSIRADLLKLGITLRDIAHDLDVADSVVSEVASGRRATPYIRRAIAAKLGRTYEDVWDEPDPGVERHAPGPKSAKHVAQCESASPATTDPVGDTQPEKTVSEPAPDASSESSCSDAESRGRAPSHPSDSKDSP